MIHNKTHQVCAETCEENPFYLLVTNERGKKVPLPLAVKSHDPEALAWRNRWESCNSAATKAYCLFHPIQRNWVGGFEDGSSIVQQCENLWSHCNA